MTKRLLTSFAALALCCAIGAQGLKAGEAKSNLNHFSSIAKGPAKAQASKVFTYFNMTGASTLGEEAAATYDCAIFVPAEYAGKQIDKVAFLLADSTLLISPKMWISSELPSSPESADGICMDITKPVSYMVDFTTVALPSAYTIPEGGCYVGYSFSVEDVSTATGKYPVITASTNEPAVNGGHYLRASVTVPEWTNMYNSGFGNLTTMVTISGDFPENGATVYQSFSSEARAVKNKGGFVSLIINGEGTSPIRSIDYTVTNTATNNSYQMYADLGENTIGFDSTGIVKVPVNAENESGTAKIKIVIDKVNGTPNTCTENISSQGTLFTLAAESKRMIVEEEFTSTSCGYCPRGITGLRLMKERYPDSFIGIAAHTNMSRPDPMKVSVYNTIVNNYGANLPSATLNRTSVIDPYYGSDPTGTRPMYIANDYEAMLEIPVECAIDVTPSWADEDYTKIKVNTNITFQYNSTSAPFSIAYVLVADSLTGTGTGWYQANYLSNDKNLISDENMREWVSKPTSIKDMVYDHVAIGGIGVANGLKGIIKSPIVEGVAQTHEYTIDISENKLVQDKRKLKIVAMLINTKTGEIVNADEKALVYDGPTGIEGVAETGNSVMEAARYTIDGRRADGKTHGLTIIKMSDGSVKKVMMK